MSWFTDLFTGGVDKVISSVGEAADRLITSDEERLKLKNELALIEAKALLDGKRMELDAETKLEEEVTKRWQADMGQEDPLAKRVRPLSLLFLLLFMSGIIIADSINIVGFDVKQGYVDLLESLLVVTFVAYLGSRGVEKVFSKRK